MLPTVAPEGLGVPQLLEIIVRGFPSPLEHPLPVVTTPDGDPREAISCDAAGPLVAEVVKTTTDPYVGRLSLVRIFSGRLAPDDVVHVSGHMERFAGTDRGHPDHDVDERVGAVSRPVGGTLNAGARAGRPATSSPSPA